MASAKLTLPDEVEVPFPDDVPTAPLLKLSLAKLVAREADEIDRFTSACTDLGFFYLDLEGAGIDTLEQSTKLFDLSKEVFDLPEEEKLKYNFEHLRTVFGYKRKGAAVIDKKGNLDRNEFFNFDKMDFLEVGDKWPAPAVIESKRTLVRDFITSTYDISILLLDLLNEYLGLPEGTLRALHPLEKPGGGMVRFVKAMPQPKEDRILQVGEHTDFGSITVLFNRLGGLQILPPGKSAEWCYVKPIPGHAVINLGDALVKFTNGLLRSNIHRVVAPPGEQGDYTRYSVVCFHGPGSDVLLRRLDNGTRIPPLADGQVEEEITSQEWSQRRALTNRVALNGKAAFDMTKNRGTEALSQREGIAA